MFGPKLDARSYTHLLLIVVASLLTLNIIAQSDRSSRDAVQTNNPRSTGFRTSSLESDADATRELARATENVASANREIADALDGIASAIKGLELNVTVQNDTSRGSNSSAGGISPEDLGLSTNEDEEDQAPTIEGTIDVN